MSVEANSGNGYVSMSGTSMATPMVAGMAVLLHQANPDLQPLMIRSILETTAEYRWLSHPVRPNNDYGWGFVEMDMALEEAIKYDASISVELDPETPIIYYEGNETDGGNDTASRFFVHENGKLYVSAIGNVSQIEWRNILIEDTWHYVGSLTEIDVMDTDLGTGNHTIWVRAVSSDGISAPITIPLNVGDPISKKTEDSPSFSFGFVILASSMAALFRSNKRQA
jgi:hypothetical protein